MNTIIQRIIIYLDNRSKIKDLEFTDIQINNYVSHPIIKVKMIA